MRMKFNTENVNLIGYSAIIRLYKIKALPHYRISYTALHGRGFDLMQNDVEIHVYPKQFAVADEENLFEHLEFALKNEGINLEIISQLTKIIPSEQFEEYILQKPTSKYRRKIWFLVEYLSGIQLNIPDLKNTPYVDLFDPKVYYTSSPIKSKRHAVNNNMLGNKVISPIVRKTQILDNFEKKDLENIVQDVIKTVDPVVLARATNYLYTKETKSSFGIERIKPDIKRISSFVKLLEDASTIPRLDKEVLLNLQNSIVDELYKDSDYRETQNYVGGLTKLYQPKIHYISPKPEDIHTLMEGFLELEQKLLESDVHPVLVATILAFEFVFLHPFEDGNGRIHRFLIHYVLSKLNFTPEYMIFPVSAVMLKNLRDYDRILESYSMPLLSVITDYILNDDGELTVNEDTKLYYQYIDFTRFAEYIFGCVEATIQEDFKGELEFIINYDQTKSKIQSIIDMPDIKIDRMIRCVTQNNGKLGKKMKRTYFQELDDITIEKIERVIRSGMLNKNN